MPRDTFEQGDLFEEAPPPPREFSSPAALLDGFIKKLKKDMLRYAPAAFVPAGMSVASVAIFTRLFGPEAYGQYSLVIATTSILTMLLAGWMQQSVLRYLPRYKANRELVRFMERFSAVLATVCVATLGILLLSYPFLKNALADYERFYFPGVVLVLTGVIFQTLNTVFQADLKSGRFAKYKIALAAGRLTLALAFVFLVSRDIIALIIGLAVSELILVVIIKLELGTWQALKKARRSFDVDFLKKFASYGFPMIGWMMGGQILEISDRFVIGAYRGATEVGIYSANYSLVSMGIGLLSGPMLMAAHPLIMSAWEKGNRTLVPGLLSIFSKYYLLVIMPVVFFVAVFSRDFVDVLLGAEYRDGYTIIPFVLAGYAVWGLSLYGQKGFELLEKTKVMLLLVIICALCNIILNLIFVPKFGYFAAAVTTFASYSLYPVLVHRASRTYLRWRLPWKSFTRILAATAVTAVVLVVVRRYVLADLAPLLTILLGGIAGLLAYVIMLLLVKEVKKGKRGHAGS
ncbi:MAG: oligosaccharide flippase family protein [Candidatus Latescibacterota bacterium]